MNEGWAALIDAEPGATAPSPPTGELVGLARRLRHRPRACPAVATCPPPASPRSAVLSTPPAPGPPHPAHGDPARRHRRASGSPVALLVAAEWPIYGRFGYGPAIDACGFEIDAPTARFRHPATGFDRAGRCPTDAAPAPRGRPRARRRRAPRAPSAGSRWCWDRIAGVGGVARADLRPRRAPRRAVARRRRAPCRVPSPTRSTTRWTRNRPAGKAEVALLVGATPEAERELWRHLCEIDWIADRQRRQPRRRRPAAADASTTAAPRSPSTTSTASGRASSTSPPPSAARRARPAGRAVVEVTDDLGLRDRALEHRPRARRGRGQAKTTATADVALPGRAPSAPLYLGGRSAAPPPRGRVARRGHPGGVDRLDATLRTPTAPWSPTTY